MQILRQTRIESSSLKFVSEVVHLTFEHQKVSKIYIYQIIREESETWKFRSKFEKLQGDYRKQRINKHFPRGIWSLLCIYKKRCDYTGKKFIYYLFEGTNKKFLYLLSPIWWGFWELSNSNLGTGSLLMYIGNVDS